MTKKLTILFTQNPEENSSCFKSVKDFIKWSLKEENQEIEIQSKIESINPKEMYNLYKFINFYKNAKAICENQTKIYNDKLLDQTYEEIKEAAKEFTRVNSGGKYLRAALVALGYKATGKTDDDYKFLASALELFQTSILIHDDIIDNAKVRRGKDTIPVSYMSKYKNPKGEHNDFEEKQKNFSNSMGICIGDLGFYIANQIIVKKYGDKPALARILDYYNEVVIKTCKGEMLDIILPFKEEYFTTDNNLEHKIMEIYKLKTAWYSVIGPYCLGLILGDAKKENIKKIEELLLGIGIAFQIQDDLLGVYGDEKQIGKSITSDLEEYKQTILYSYTMNTEYKNELKKYYGTKLTHKEVNTVKEIFEKSITTNKPSLPKIEGEDLPPPLRFQCRAKALMSPLYKAVSDLLDRTLTNFPCQLLNLRIIHLLCWIDLYWNINIKSVTALSYNRLCLFRILLNLFLHFKFCCLFIIISRISTCSFFLLCKYIL